MLSTYKEWLGIVSIFLLLDISHNFWSTSDVSYKTDLCQLGGIYLEHHCCILAFIFSHFQSFKTHGSAVCNSWGSNTDKMLMSASAVNAHRYILCLLSVHHFCRCPGMCCNQDGCRASTQIWHHILLLCPPVKRGRGAEFSHSKVGMVKIRFLGTFRYPACVWNWRS